MKNSKPYRVIQTDFLTEPDLDDWTFEELAFYVFLIVSPFTQLSGIINVSERILAATFRLTTQQVRALLETIERRGKIVRENNVIWLKNFIRYQNINGDALIRAAKELEQLGENSLIYSSAKEIYPEIFETRGRHRDNPRSTPAEPVVIPPVDPPSTPAEPTGTVTVTETVSVSEIKNIKNIEHTNVCLSSQDNEDASENILKVDSKIDRTPYQQIVDMYHSLCPDLPRVKVLNDTRKRLLRARWRQYPDFRFWESFFKRVHESDFLNGRLSLRDDKPPFIADLEWLVRPSNFAKVLEGKYDNRKSKKELEEEEYYEQIRRQLGID